MIKMKLTEDTSKLLQHSSIYKPFNETELRVEEFYDLYEGSFCKYIVLDTNKISINCRADDINDLIDIARVICYKCKIDNVINRYSKGYCRCQFDIIALNDEDSDNKITQEFNDEMIKVAEEYLFKPLAKKLVEYIKANSRIITDVLEDV